MEADVEVNTDEDNVGFSVILERGKNITIKQKGFFDISRCAYRGNNCNSKQYRIYNI